MSGTTTHKCGRHLCTSSPSPTTHNTAATYPRKRNPSSLSHTTTSNGSFLSSGVNAVRLHPVLSVVLCLLLGAASMADAFSVRWDRPAHHDLQLEEEGGGLKEPQWDDDGEYGGAAAYNKEQVYNGEDGMEEESDGPEHVDQYISVLKRWGHQSRFPWKRLRNGMCFRKPCNRDRDCCKRYNLCDGSAKVCIDCWYKSKCRSERDCCMNYPYCQRAWKTDRRTGKRLVGTGSCVNKL